MASTIGAHFDGLYNLPDGQTLAEAVKAGTQSLKFSIEIGRAMAHGLSGGVFSELGGGDFGGGFAAGAFGSLAGSAMTTAKGQGFFGQAGDGDFTGLTKRTVAAAIVGGTAAELGGGKFANGAATAGIQHLFNSEGVIDEIDQSLRNQPKDLVTVEIIAYELEGIPGELGFSHAFILVTGKNGTQWVLRGGPDGPINAGSSAQLSGTSFGFAADPDVMLEGAIMQKASESNDYQTARARGISHREIIVQSRNLSIVDLGFAWDDYSTSISRARIPYSSTKANSNSLVFTFVREHFNSGFSGPFILPGADYDLGKKL